MGRHEDDRGVILDLLDAVDSVTQVTTRKGAVRGNHVHRATDQWTYIVTGRLLTAKRTERREVGPGQMILEPMGVPHAWKALEDTVCLVFTRGPRSGDAYETDTYRLDTPILS
jgi:quercetin dioxygenase-like cupin family protein